MFTESTWQLDAELRAHGVADELDGTVIPATSGQYKENDGQERPHLTPKIVQQDMVLVDAQVIEHFDHRRIHHRWPSQSSGAGWSSR